jgi:N-acetyl-anhydromuramyl-L-alanine amidase AmpD
MSTVPLAPWLVHRPRRGATHIDTAVLHFSEEQDFEALVAHLRHLELSYHYIIAEDGTVHKCVPYSAMAYHANNSYGPHEAARGVSREQDARHHFVELTTVNEYTISICLIQSGGPPPEAQFVACRTLLQDLKTPLPKLKTLTTHAWVAPGQVPELDRFDIPRLAVEADLEVWMPQ